MPPYENYATLKDKLVKAIEGSQGFAGVDWSEYFKVFQWIHYSVHSIMKIIP